MTSATSPQRGRAPARPGPVRRLAPRAEPRQERAKRTLAHVLDVAAALLDEVGPAAFNTNLLAARAGVRVRTVYRYFPNKQAVVVALARRMADEWSGWFDFDALADPGSDWRRGWDAQIRRFAAGLRALPGGLAVRRAMQASPELRAIDQDDNARLAARLATALHARGLRASPRRAEVVARNLIESAVAVLDLALLHDGAAAPMRLAELARMQVAYLETLIAT